MAYSAEAPPCSLPPNIFPQPPKITARSTSGSAFIQEAECGLPARPSSPYAATVQKPDSAQKIFSFISSPIKGPQTFNDKNYTDAIFIMPPLRPLEFRPDGYSPTVISNVELQTVPPYFTLTKR